MPHSAEAVHAEPAPGLRVLIIVSRSNRVSSDHQQRRLAMPRIGDDRPTN